MLRLHFRHDEEAIPATPVGKYVVHKKQFTPLGGVKNLLLHSSGTLQYFAKTAASSTGSTPGYKQFELDLNDGTVQVFKCTGDQLKSYIDAWENGKNGGSEITTDVDHDIPIDFYGGGKVGLPWGVPFTVRTLLTADAEAGETQRLGWELHKPNPADPNGTLGLKYMPRFVRTNGNLVSGADERPYEFTTGQNLVAGISLPMHSAAQGISRIQLITPADGRVMELKRSDIFQSQRRYWNVSKYNAVSGYFFFRFPEPWVLPSGSKLLTDGGTDLSANDDIVPLEMVGLQSAGRVDMSAVNERA